MGTEVARSALKVLKLIRPIGVHTLRVWFGHS